MSHVLLRIFMLNSRCEFVQEYADVGTWVYASSVTLNYDCQAPMSFFQDTSLTTILTPLQATRLQEESSEGTDTGNETTDLDAAGSTLEVARGSRERGAGGGHGGTSANGSSARRSNAGGNSTGGDNAGGSRDGGSRGGGVGSLADGVGRKSRCAGGSAGNVHASGHGLGDGDDAGGAGLLSGSVWTGLVYWAL